jgi:CobQ-like glutamine amidotransferase family enzyme
MKIVHLFPDLLGTYGDRGNVICLAQRAAWRGIDVTVEAVERGDALPDDADLIFMGGGQDRAQELIAPELFAMGPRIGEASANGATVFAVCGGYQLLGSRYGGVPGLGLLDLWTEPGTNRILGNASIESELAGTIVGFENHGGRTYLGPAAKPLGRVTNGRGNNGEDHTEGAIQGNIIGTYLHGPVLPRNPALADALLARAARTELPAMDDALEHAAHDRGLELARKRRI